MPKSKLNDAQKARVVELVQQKVAQTTVAQFFNVSPRTITRVLEENGMIHTRRTLSDQEKDFLALMREVNMPVDDVRKHLQTPVMTTEAVNTMLASCTQEELSTLFFSVVRVKLLNEMKQQHESQEAARMKAGEMKQEALYA